VVTFVTQVSGTVEEFDVEAFKANLALLCAGWVSPSDIEVTVTPASVVVTSRIIAANASATASTVEILDEVAASNSTASLSNVLGVTIETVQPPTTEIEVFAPAPPPSGGVDGATIGAIAAGGLLVIVCGVAAAVYCCKRRPTKPKRELPATYFTNMAPPTVTVEDDEEPSRNDTRVPAPMEVSRPPPRPPPSEPPELSQTTPVPDKRGEQKGELKGEEGNWFDGVLSPLALCSADRKQSKRTDEGWLQDG